MRFITRSRVNSNAPVWCKSIRTGVTLYAFTTILFIYARYQFQRFFVFGAFRCGFVPNLRTVRCVRTDKRIRRIKVCCRWYASLLPALTKVENVIRSQSEWKVSRNKASLLRSIRCEATRVFLDYTFSSSRDTTVRCVSNARDTNVLVAVGFFAMFKEDKPEELSNDVEHGWYRDR